MDLTMDNIKNTAINTLRTEADAVRMLIEFVNDDFVNCIKYIYKNNGRVIVTGIGKSAIIGEKIVATLNSTGTPSIFMHAADAIHGDLGIVQKNDVIICISNSGTTPEIKILIPFLKLSGNKLIAMVGNRDSYLAQQADFVIETTVSQEACPNNLAPTSSTTAQMAMGDAMAVSLLELRGFTSEDFALYHPGGALGKKLFLKVADIYVNNEKPMVDAQADIPSAIIEISSKRLGATAVLEKGKLIGIITDGDLRRMLLSGKALHEVCAREIMTKDPKTISPDILVAQALDIMRSNNITQLPVVNDGEYLGVIHLHDILKEGLF
jgi:arabinose-5-phosphate isomerase